MDAVLAVSPLPQQVAIQMEGEEKSWLLGAPTTDPELLERSRDPADDPAWKGLWDRYHGPIVRACERSGLKRSEGEEISQEVFSKLARRLDRRPLHHPSESLRAWLTRTTHHLILDRHRSRRRHPLGPAALALLQEWLPPATLSDEENRMRERMEGHLWSVCLARVRSSSPARHWQIFEAYALEGMSSAEVARSFGTTGFNVRQIRRRLVARLRREWASLVTQPIEPEPEPEP